MAIGLLQLSASSMWSCLYQSFLLCRSKEFDEDCSPPKKAKPNPTVEGSPSGLGVGEEEKGVNVSGRKDSEHDSSSNRQTPPGGGGALLGLSAYSDSDSGTEDE